MIFIRGSLTKRLLTAVHRQRRPLVQERRRTPGYWAQRVSASDLCRLVWDPSRPMSSAPAWSTSVDDDPLIECGSQRPHVRPPSGTARRREAAADLSVVIHDPEPVDTGRKRLDPGVVPRQLGSPCGPALNRMAMAVSGGDSQNEDGVSLGQFCLHPVTVVRQDHESMDVDLALARLCG